MTDIATLECPLGKLPAISRRESSPSGSSARSAGLSASQVATEPTITTNAASACPGSRRASASATIASAASTSEPMSIVSTSRVVAPTTRSQWGPAGPFTTDARSTWRPKVVPNATR